VRLRNLALCLSIGAVPGGFRATEWPEFETFHEAIVQWYRGATLDLAVTDGRNAVVGAVPNTGGLDPAGIQDHPAAIT
jgi:uncharacterized protein (DUF362 family)